MKKKLSTALISLCFIASSCQFNQESQVQDDGEQITHQPQEITTLLEQKRENSMDAQKTTFTTAAEVTAIINQDIGSPEIMVSRADSAPGAIAPMMSRQAKVQRHGFHDSVSLPPRQMNTESYIYDKETGFIATNNDPLSTFSADVDTASYANIRRFLNNGQQPPVGAVRIEEMVNYFNYAYPQPTQHPIGITTEVGPCPWEPSHRLVQIGIQAVDIDKADLPPSNLVFLIDVSGSMGSPQKLGLLKKSMQMLVAELGARDRVAIVVYAGADRIVLNSTSCDQKATIYNAIDTMRSGGSTNGAGGIQAAYRLAEQGFMPNGNNRIILASDGDFNVGTTTHGELTKLIENKRETGVFLTVLGFGRGNYHDSTMEVLADKGNGNYAYIDTLLEAKKVLVKEMGGTMHTIAKDVKLQVEFNPAVVAGYRLVGYKNRRLADEDFNNDTKDAGEMGAGHSVTALYEIIPVGEGQNIPSVDPLKYQEHQRRERQRRKTKTTGDLCTELLTVKVRYKEAKGSRSKLISHVIQAETQRDNTTDFNFTSSVAAFGLKLGGSRYAGTMSYQNIIDLAKMGKGVDDNGYRAEFIRLVEKAELI